jgi:preprotein translocase subunit SecF
MSKKQQRREQARLRAMRAMEPHQAAAHEAPKEEPKSERRTAASGWKATLERLYEKEYKKLAWFTIIILVLAIAQIGYQMATTGDFITKGVSLKGGITVTAADTDVLPAELEDALRGRFPEHDIAVRGISGGGKHGMVIEADITDKDGIADFRDAAAEALGLPAGELSTEEIGSSLGDSFFRQVIISLIVAFVLMAIVVIAWFRNIGPSMIVILAAFCDMVETIAISNLLGIKMSTGGIAALLMLVGYSVDTDILLSTRILKRKEGTVYDATVDAFKTGIMMTGTALAAVIIGYLISNSDAMRQIMLILIIGLVLDILNTWIQNAALLRWWVERKKAGGGA